ncbi:MAG: beta-glucosidase, partial [Halieaceae bacterium]
ADLSERSILETHVPPFEAAIESGVLSIMVAGGDVNAVPVPASKKMLTGLLRDRLGFKGVTISDWEDVYRLHSRHKVAVDRKEAIARAFNAGLDINMAVADIGAVDIMVELVEEGRIAIERVDEAVRNVLYVKCKLGLFDQQPVDIENAGTLVGSAESRATGKQIALQSMTLLKNEAGLLPLSKSTKSILVTGSSANSKRHLCAGWTLGWASAEEEDLNCKTVLESIREIVSPGTQITHVEDLQQLQALDLTKEDFDVCISVVSEEPHAEWFGDSMDLKLEEGETAMLEAASATGLPVVMLSLLGRPLDICWAAENIAAILWAYSPGTEGAAAIAEVLFGDFNPCGKLPISFPRNASQIPVVYNARNYQSDEINTRYDPLYPFGHGLSYTRFEYSELQVPATVAVGQGLDLTVGVKNVGEVDGCEVVQIYLRDVYASVSRPLKSLKAFARVELKPGEMQTLHLSLTPRQLSLYNEDLDFVEEPREIDVLVGDQTSRFTLISC